MEPQAEQISKKELLEATGISYGQLYSWKRKGLIPEAWFVKKSAFTGQETFFPRTVILERVERILGLKDTTSLDQLAQLLSPRPAHLKRTRAELMEGAILSGPALDLLAETLAPEEPLGFEAILLAKVIDGALQTGEMTRQEGALILRTLREPGALEGQVLLLRKGGVSVCLVVQGEARMDLETRTVARIDLAAMTADLKLALDGGRR
jgi:DNA-binding transcriptional MerR regulator